MVLLFFFLKFFFEVIFALSLKNNKSSSSTHRGFMEMVCVFFLFCLCSFVTQNSNVHLFTIMKIHEREFSTGILETADCSLMSFTLFVATKKIKMKLFSNLPKINTFQKTPAYALFFQKLLKSWFLLHVNLKLPSFCEKLPSHFSEKVVIFFHSEPFLLKKQHNKVQMNPS
jgi:hypothetical protein